MAIRIRAGGQRTTGLWDGCGGGAGQGLVAQLVAERDASSSPAGSLGDNVFGTVVLTPTLVAGERGLSLVSLGQRGLVEQAWKQAGCIRGDETWAQGAWFVCLLVVQSLATPQSTVVSNYGSLKATSHQRLKKRE